MVPLVFAHCATCCNADLTADGILEDPVAELMRWNILFPRDVSLSVPLLITFSLMGSSIIPSAVTTSASIAAIAFIICFKW